MTKQTPVLGAPLEEFTLPQQEDQFLQNLLEQANLGEVHFFIAEGIALEAIKEMASPRAPTYGLLPYAHPEEAIDDETFRLLEESEWEAATLRDLLLFAIERPELQHEYEVLALGTLRTRKLFADKPGETSWSQKERDRSICQWAVGLSNTKTKRTIIPMELYLTKLLRKKAVLLVKK